METTIQTIKAFKVAGLLKENIESIDCPAVWEDLFGNYSIGQLVSLGNGRSYGVCIENPNLAGIDYMAGFDLTDESDANELGLNILEIPERDYVILKIRGAVPTSIHQGFDYLYRDFFPNSKWRPLDTVASFEYYYDGDMSQEDYQMELWVPVQ